MPGFLVLDVAEFAPLVAAARRHPEIRVTRISKEYWSVTSDRVIEITRSECGLCEAVWFGALTAGLSARIERFDADVLRLVDINAASPAG